MNLRKKKELAAKALKVGKERIALVGPRAEEIKEAITRQDIIQLHKDGAIKIKEVKGRKKVVKRKRKRGPGKIKKKLNKRKEEYMAVTRKLRNYLKELKKQGKIGAEEAKDIRKKIRNKHYRSKAHFKELVNVGRE